MRTDQYETRGGIRVTRTVDDIPIANAIEPIVAALDTHRGALLASNYEYPGRYTRWDMGFVDPPLVLVARGRDFRVEALNARGRVLLPPVAAALAELAAARAARRGRRQRSRAPFARRPGGSPRRIEAASRRSSPCSAPSSSCSTIPTSHTSACTAPSATTWPSSSSPSASGSRDERTSAISCSTCRTSS